MIQAFRTHRIKGISMSGKSWPATVTFWLGIWCLAKGKIQRKKRRNRESADTPSWRRLFLFASWSSKLNCLKKVKYYDWQLAREFIQLPRNWEKCQNNFFLFSLLPSRFTVEMSNFFQNEVLFTQQGSGLKVILKRQSSMLNWIS